MCSKNSIEDIIRSYKAKSKILGIDYLDFDVQGKKVMARVKNREVHRVEIPDFVTHIAKDGFSHCDNLREIKLNEGLQEIGKCAFYWCTRLDKVDIPSSIKKIDEFAFANCVSLKRIEIPESLKVISKGCFSDCNRLEEIQALGDIKHIKTLAFMACTSLKIANFKRIDRVHSSAFLRCRELEEFNTIGKIRVCANNSFEGALLIHFNILQE